jgi:hypothetical protein
MYIATLLGASSWGHDPPQSRFVGLGDKSWLLLYHFHLSLIYFVRDFSLARCFIYKAGKWLF